MSRYETNESLGRTKTRSWSTAMTGAAVGVAGMVAGMLMLGQTASADAGQEPTLAEPDHLVEIDGDAAAWDAFDLCLVDQGVLMLDDLAPMDLSGPSDPVDVPPDTFDEITFVTVESGGSLTFVEFGEGDGSITITKTGDEIEVTSTGDVYEDTIDSSEPFMGDEPELTPEQLAEITEFDAAIQACEGALPKN